MNSITTAVVHDFVAPDGGRGGEDHMALARGLTIALGVLGTGAILLASVDIKHFDAFQRIIGLFGGGVRGLPARGLRAVRTRRGPSRALRRRRGDAFVATETDVTSCSTRRSARAPRYRGSGER